MTLFQRDEGEKKGNWKGHRGEKGGGGGGIEEDIATADLLSLCFRAIAGCALWQKSGKRSEEKPGIFDTLATEEDGRGRLGEKRRKRKKEEERDGNL